MDEPKKKEKKTFRIEVDKRRCKGCGICVALCPKNVLELKMPELKCEAARIKDCIGCLMCEMHCPDFAIVCEPGKDPSNPSKKEASGSEKGRAEVKT
jgi:2-oxoglutarate ferredoxin oxidoreductase subunit delta